MWAALQTPRGERIEDLWRAYAADRIADGVAEKRLADNWQRIAPHFAHRLGKAITREDCRAFHQTMREAGYAASTVRTDLEMLRACLNWALRDDAPKLWIAPPSRPRDRWLTREEAMQLVDAAETPHVRLFIVLGLTTGARAAAITDLTWDRVDLAGGTIDYRPAGRETTNKRRTVVPINARARAELEAAYAARLTDHVIEFGGKPVQSVKKAIERLAQRTKIPVSPHVLRHTCAVWLAQADVPMQKIAQYLGHTSTRVTEQTYARYSPSYMRDASEAVNW